MMTIPQMQGFPNGTPIDSVQAKIIAVYQRNEMPDNGYGPGTVQNAQIQDVAGNKMYIKAWNHPDLAKLKDMEVVIHAGNGGKGLKVSHNTYTPKGKTEPKTDILLEVSKTGQFQTVAVYKETNPSTAVQTPEATKTPIKGETSPKASGLAGKPIHGATAGLATNKAVDVLIASGQLAQVLSEGKLEDAVLGIGGAIARAALRIESGEIGISEKAVKTANKPEQIATKVNPNTGEINEEPSPF